MISHVALVAKKVVARIASVAAKAASEWRSHAQFFALSLIMVRGAEKTKPIITKPS